MLFPMIHQESIEPSYFPCLSVPVGREKHMSHIWLNSFKSGPLSSTRLHLQRLSQTTYGSSIQEDSIIYQTSRFNPSVTIQNWVAILFWEGHQESCDLSLFAAPVCASYQLFARLTIYIKCCFMNLNRHVIFIIPWHFKFTGHLTQIARLVCIW